MTSLRLCRLSVLKPPADFASAPYYVVCEAQERLNGIFLACGFVAHFGTTFLG